MLIILRNYFEIENTDVNIMDLLDSAASMNTHYELIKTKILQSKSRTSIDPNHLVKILDTAKSLTKTYNLLEGLRNCYHLKYWSYRMNSNVCDKCLMLQVKNMLSIVVMLIGLVIIIAGAYSGENVIRGLYNEEIQYVKTNKLRYDWN